MLKMKHRYAKHVKIYTISNATHVIDLNKTIRKEEEDLSDVERTQRNRT